MKYCSTSGTPEYDGLSFEDTLYHGYLPDGGLIVPKTLPEISKQTLSEWSKLSYKDLCFEFLMLFIGEDFISRNELKGLLFIIEKWLL